MFVLMLNFPRLMLNAVYSIVIASYLLGSRQHIILLVIYIAIHTLDQLWQWWLAYLIVLITQVTM